MLLRPRWLSVNPPAVLPAQTFLRRFIELVASSDPSFISATVTAPPTSPEAAASSDLCVTASPTINFLQLALVTVQRAPAVGSSGVQARGERGGVPREWEALVRRYKGSGGAMSSEAMHEVRTGKGAGGRLSPRVGSNADAIELVPQALLHTSTNTFLIPPPRGAGGGADMLQSLMGSLFGGGGGAPARVGR